MCVCVCERGQTRRFLGDGAHFGLRLNDFNGRLLTNGARCGCGPIGRIYHFHLEIHCVCSVFQLYTILKLDKSKLSSSILCACVCVRVWLEGV